MHPYNPTSFVSSEGLTFTDRNLLDVVSGGVFMDKTPTIACYLISNMAENNK